MKTMLWAIATIGKIMFAQANKIKKSVIFQKPQPKIFSFNQF